MSRPCRRFYVMAKYTKEFECFWKLYPGRYSERTNKYPKSGKYLASLEWDRLDKEEKAQALWVMSKKLVKEGRYVKDACRWLKYKHFDDFEPPKEPFAPSLPAELTNRVKSVDSSVININNERNRQLDDLKL